MHSHHMTDALLKGQLHLDIEVPKALLEAEKPYDPKYREKHGMIINYNLKDLDFKENVLLGDRTFYKGKYYSHFGMLPVVVLFAPYKLITGHYLPSSMGAFLFATMATILLMLLWKRIAQNYLKKIPYFFFLIGGASLYACSFIPVVLTNSQFHIIPQFSALAFVILGVIMLLQAREKHLVKFLFLASVSFAFAVACRPSALLWSIFIPVLLWDKKRELLNVKGLFAVIIPFAIVGSILAWYNYARFDSLFEFGDAYMILQVNQTVFNQVSIIGKIHSTIKIFLFVLFNPPNLDLTFPFVMPKMSNVPLARSFLMYDREVITGIFCFPIMWFLLLIRKVNILRNFVFAGIFISLLNIVTLCFHYSLIAFRYNMDFVWIIAIIALICAFSFQEREFAMRKTILKVFYSCCMFTLLLVFFSTISFKLVLNQHFAVPLDLKIWHYLARTFGIICNVPWS